MPKRFGGPSLRQMWKGQKRTAAEDALDAPEGDSRPEDYRLEGGFADPEEELRFFLGEVTDGQVEAAKEAFVELRKEIDQMDWFSMGPNSVGGEKTGQKWSQLVFAPRDSEHARKLEEVLEKLHIYPFAEVEDNVHVLVVEHRRDIALLRAGYIFTYLESKPERVEQQRAMRQMEADMKRLSEEYAKKAEERRISEELLLEQENLKKLREEERERRIVAFFQALPLIDKAILEARPVRRDPYFQFPYGPQAPIAQGPRRRKEGYADPVQPQEEGPLDAVRFFEQFEEDFRSGKENEDTLERGILEAVPLERRRTRPDLSLFPRTYGWKFADGKKGKGHLERLATGEAVSEADVIAQVQKFQEGTPAERERAFRELSLMCRQLTLYVMRGVQERHLYANADEMFAVALCGILYAAERFRLPAETPFRTYMIPCVEGLLRGEAATHRFRQFHVPEYLGAHRQEYYRAKDAVEGANPAAKAEPTDIAAELHRRGATSDDSIAALDRYLRRALVTYEEMDSSVLESEEHTSDEVSSLGQALFEEAVQDGGAASELKETISHLLAGLTPREERVLRRRFELSGSREHNAAWVFDTIMTESSAAGAPLSRDGISEKLRSLNTRDAIAHPENVPDLSEEDRAFIMRYRELASEATEVESATLEEVGNEFSVTRERIRQMEAKALRKLKHPANARKLRHFLSDEAQEEYNASRRRSYY